MSAFDDLIQSALTEVRAKKIADDAIAQAKPNEPVFNNPWVLQGTHLLMTESTCQHCKSVQEVSHGLVECHQHKRTGDLWETALAYTGKDFFPDAPFLGRKYIGKASVNGCSDCIDQLMEANV